MVSLEAIHNMSASPTLGFLRRLGRELEAGDLAASSPTMMMGMTGLNSMLQDAWSSGHHFLLAKCLIFVDVEVEHMDLREKWRRRSRQFKSCIKLCA